MKRTAHARKYKLEVVAIIVAEAVKVVVVVFIAIAIATAIAIAIVIAVRNELDAVGGVLKVGSIRRWCARDLPPIFRRSVPITSSPNK